MDPYSMLMHYKRAFKLMEVMKENKAKALILIINVIVIIITTIVIQFALH